MENQIETFSPQDQPPVPGNPAVARKRFSAVGLACFVILAVTVITQALIALLVYRFAPQVLSQDWYTWLMTFVPLYCIGVPLGLLILRRQPAAPPQVHTMKPGAMCICVMISFFLMLLGNWIGIGLLALIQKLTNVAATNPLESFVFGGNILVNIIIFVVLAPTIEEFVFRKTIIDRVREYGEGTAILVSALLFGLVHGNFSQFFYAFGLGLFFAYLYVRTGKLRYSIFLHMLINLLGSILAPWLISQVDLNALSNLSDPQALMKAFTPALVIYEIYALTLFALALAGFIILIVKRKSFHLLPAEHQLPQGVELHTALVNVGMILMIVACAGMFVLSFIG